MVRVLVTRGVSRRLRCVSLCFGIEVTSASRCACGPLWTVGATPHSLPPAPPSPRWAMEVSFIWPRVLQARANMTAACPDMTRFARHVSPYPNPHSFPPPVGLGRGAQPKADQGERLSEAKPSSSSTPLSASTAGCPQRSGGTQTIGSPFFWVLFFGEAKTKCLARRGETRPARSTKQEKLATAHQTKSGRSPRRTSAASYYFNS